MKLSKRKIIGIIISICTLGVIISSSVIYFTDPVTLAKFKRIEIDMSERKQNQFYGIDEEIKKGLGSSTECSFTDFNLTFDEKHYLKSGYIDFLVTLYNKQFIFQFNKTEGQNKVEIFFHGLAKNDEYYSHFSSSSNKMIFDIFSKTMDDHNCDYNYSGISLNGKIYREKSYLYENQNITELTKSMLDQEYMYIECFPQESDVVINKTEYYYFK